MIEKKDWSWIGPLKEAFLKRAPVTETHLTEKNYREDLGDAAMDAVSFERSNHPCYMGEVGKKSGDFVYHFYAKGEGFPANFQAKLGDAFVSVYRMEDRLSWSHDQLFACTNAGCPFKGKEQDLTNGMCPDCGRPVNMILDSWAVKAQGFANNPLADTLATKLFKELDWLLEV